MTAVRFDLFGGFQITLPSNAIMAVSSKKGRALLSYLALQKRGQTREHLINLLWSTREPSHSYNSLRHELVELRRTFLAFSPALLNIEGNTVAVNASVVETDAAEFERLSAAPTAAGLQRAAQLYRGPLLAGLVVRDSVFEAWLTGERNRLHELAIDVLERLTAYAPTLVTAQRLLALDSLREASHRLLMRIYAEQGQADLALRQYETCREMLRHELDVAPAAETEQLYQQIRSGKLQPRSFPAEERGELLQPEQARAGPGKPLVVVLPFEIVNHEPGLDALAVGLMEDLISSLVRFRLVSVTSRHATRAYTDPIIELRGLGRELGAHYVLTGSLRKSAERIRVTAQLIDAQTGCELWAERYDRDFTDSFVIQDELTQVIVGGLEHELVSAENRRIIRPPSGGDWSLTRKASWHLFRFTRDDNAKAIDILRQSIVKNPNADRRFQALSLALGIDLIFGWAEQREETIAAMLAAAEHAVSIREQDAWNYAPLIWALTFAHQFDRAIAGHERMIELNPNSGVSFGVSAIVLAHCGDAEYALDLLDQAQRIAPQAPFMFNYLTGGAIASFRLGRYGTAANLAQSALLRRPNYFQPYLIQAAALACGGETRQAEPLLATARKLAPALNEAWLKPLIPLRETADFRLLVDGLRKAGWDG
jgi:TolB-like protein